MTQETKRRSVRVPDDRWERYGALAAQQGTNASEKLNAHMQAEIDSNQGSDEK